MTKTFLFITFLISPFCSASSIAFFYALDQDLTKLERLGASSVRSFKVGTTSVSEFGLNGHQIFAVKMGSGSVNSCLSAQALLSRQRCDLAISVGVVGGIGKEAAVGKWYTVNEVVAWEKGSQRGEQFVLNKDARTKTIPSSARLEIDDLLGKMPPLGVASGERFIASDSFRSELAAQTKCGAVGMNLAGLLAALNSHQVESIHFRVVSDLADSDASDVFKQFSKNYSGQGAEIAIQLIRSLPVDRTTPEAHDSLRKLLKSSEEIEISKP